MLIYRLLAFLLFQR